MRNTKKDIEEKKYIKSMQFQSRMGKYITNVYYIRKAFADWSLGKNILIEKTNDFYKTYNDVIVKDIKIMQGSDETEKAKWEEDLLKQTLSNHKKDVEKILPTLYNQTLVTICTVFDAYLTDCLSVIIRSDPKYILPLYKKDIPIKDIYKKDSYEKLLSDIHDEIIKSYDYKGVLDKIKTFYDKLGLKKDTFYFSQSNDDFKNKYPDPEGVFEELKNTRDNIVHKNEMPLKKYDELTFYSEFLTHFILKIAIVFWREFKVTSDVAVFSSGDKELVKLIKF